MPGTVPFSRFLDTNGDGTGTKNANGDYSLAAETFYYEAGSPTVITRMLITVSDTGAFRAEYYGALGAALTNGITVQLVDSGDNVIQDLTDALPVKFNAGWGTFCYDVDLKTWGAGNEFLLARWTFEKSGKPLELDTGDKLVVTLNDNLSGLVRHYFLVQGWDRVAG